MLLGRRMSTLSFSSSLLYPFSHPSSKITPPPPPVLANLAPMYFSIYPASHLLSFKTSKTSWPFLQHFNSTSLRTAIVYFTENFTFFFSFSTISKFHTTFLTIRRSCIVVLFWGKTGLLRKLGFIQNKTSLLSQFFSVGIQLCTQNGLSWTIISFYKIL